MERVYHEVHRSQRTCDQTACQPGEVRGGKFVAIPNTGLRVDVDLVLFAMGFTGPVRTVFSTASA